MEQYWYVLFVKTGYEQIIEKSLQMMFRGRNLMPFTPKAESIVKVSGQIRKEKRVMFPGYLFIETDFNETDFCECLREIKVYLQEIVRILRYGNTVQCFLIKEEREFLRSMFNQNHEIEPSMGIIVNGNLLITNGPLVGKEGFIKKIDRHKRRATVEMQLFGSIRLIHVALEIVEKSS